MFVSLTPFLKVLIHFTFYTLLFYFNVAGRRVTRSGCRTRSEGPSSALALSYDYRDRSAYRRSLRPDLFVIFNDCNRLFFGGEVRSWFTFDYGLSLINAAVTNFTQYKVTFSIPKHAGANSLIDLRVLYETMMHEMIHIWIFQRYPTMVVNASDHKKMFKKKMSAVIRKGARISFRTSI